MCTQENHLLPSNAGPPAKGTPEKGFATIASFYSFNERRFGDPWICLMTDRGEYDFKKMSVLIPAPDIPERPATLWSSSLLMVRFTVMARRIIGEMAPL